MQQGTWSQEEHDRFLTGAKIYPDGPWRMIARFVGTRSVRQVQTHAQKYHEKIARRMRGLRKERRNHVRIEHRIDGDVFNVQPEPTLVDFHFGALHLDSVHVSLFQFPVDAFTPVTPLSIQQPLRRLAMPSLTIERGELPDEPVLDYSARTIANESTASVVV